ncbi:MAG: glutamine amidotransferase [Chromatiales bacterium 21-64-14]|nr:MAG: glutamine amidotransferase [Chromatiales bacterium 21-64-14]HQU15412.1 glutamine amidotransferase [Gammaproteobacteria bacterium]
MKSAVVVRHVPFEDLGSFRAVLERNGYRIEYREAGIDDLAGLEPEAELLVILGGPIGANDEADYPFLVDELRVLETRLAARRPTLGICLGAQLMARALGARVYTAPRKEIGWSSLRLSEAARGGCLEPLGTDDVPVLHWHGDTFDLPQDARRLASTEICVNQAFAWGPSALALQFHPEVTTTGLERWWIGHAAEIGGTAGLCVRRLREDTRRWGPTLERVGPGCLDAWIREVGG